MELNAPFIDMELLGDLCAKEDGEGGTCKWQMRVNHRFNGRHIDRHAAAMIY